MQQNLKKKRLLLTLTPARQNNSSKNCNSVALLLFFYSPVKVELNHKVGFKHRELLLSITCLTSNQGWI